MAVNPYFRSNYNGRADQNLLDSLVIESIKIHGHDCYYIPRTLVAFDQLYAEDKLSAFKEAITLEIYLISANGFEGDKDIITEFGLEIRDEIKFSISKKRFKDEITRARMDVKVPRDGDLIYIPIDKSVFEITFVEDVETFYQLGNLYTYGLTCKRFEFGAEKFDSGISEVDTFENDFGTSTDIVFDNVIGSFMQSEMIYQGLNLVDATARAKVKSYSSSNKKISITDVYGNFNQETPVIGHDSLAIGNFIAEPVYNSNEINKDNVLVKEYSAPRINRTETNPNL